MASEPSVSLANAGLRLGGRWIWRHVDLEIAQGEFLVVLGPNGAGKTTLLRSLLGLLNADEGRISILGNEPAKARNQIGYVPQRRTFDRDMFVRARDLVSLGVDGTRWGVRLPGSRSRQRREMVDEALAAVGASAYADRAVGHLSGGEQQRLLLAQALVTRPRLLLLDEPLASLDLHSQATVSNLVAEVAKERNITVVLVAHDVNSLISVLNRVAYVANGKITSGVPDEVITSEHLSALYEYPVEVLRDSRGRRVVVGLGDRDAHHD